MNGNWHRSARWLVILLPGLLAAQQTRHDTASAPAGRPYFEFQVEKPVQVIPGSSSPRYPEMLRARKVEGEVLAQFIVDTTGQYEQGSFRVIKSSHALFTAAVRDALLTMKFLPAEIGGRKVRQIVQQPFTFSVAH